ncbi:hypothetical protein SEVIR_9G031551v4 [Setaria viridis]
MIRGSGRGGRRTALRDNAVAEHARPRLNHPHAVTLARSLRATGTGGGDQKRWAIGARTHGRSGRALRPSQVVRRSLHLSFSLLSWPVAAVPAGRWPALHRL